MILKKSLQLLFQHTVEYLQPQLRNLANGCLRFNFSMDQSKYFRPRVSVQSFMRQHNIDYKETASHYRVRVCPFCKKPHYDQISNLYTLNIHKEQGMYFCFRCSAKGSWLDYMKTALGIDISPATDDGPTTQAKISQAEYFIYRDNLAREQYSDVKQYLLERGLSQATLKVYNIGAGTESFFHDEQILNKPSVYLPIYRVLSKHEQEKHITEPNQCYMNDFTEIVKVKVRAVGKKFKMLMKQYPSGSQKGFFGLCTVPKFCEAVVITEGEYDAMAVFQATGMAAISLPYGAANLSDSMLPMLDSFKKIYLWMDNDQAGRINEEKIAYKLGISRTHIVRNNYTDCKDANDLLKKDPTLLMPLLLAAQAIPDQHVLRFASMRQQIKNRIFKMQESKGLQLPWFKFFNRSVKGFRQNQLTVVSGPTGSGKTTLLSQMSVELARQGVGVLWGSFQIRNQVLISNMLIQYSNINLSRNLPKFQYFAERFSQLPLFYLSFHGSNDIEKVLNTIIYAVEKYNIALVVIDTLQFLLSGQGEGFKKFEIQDELMARLRKITLDYNVHIAIVIHPRKTDDGEDIGIHSIYGTSKATQEADNIWVVQARAQYKIFDIKKNRYDGEVGKAAIGFNKENKSFFQFTRTELEKVFNKQCSVEDIIAKRNGDTAEEKEEEKIQSKFFQKNKIFKK